MRKALTLASIAAASLLAAFLLRAQDAAPAPAQEPQKITVKAKKFEWNPSTIEVKVNRPVEITFESEDTKHGFEQKDLGIEKVIIAKDAPQTVKFTPTKAGTYPFKCAKFCGMGHSGMKGQIVVVE